VELLLRDRLFVLAHNEEDGFKPRIDVRLIGIALVGAVLCDLMRLGFAQLVGGSIRPLTQLARQRADDDVMDAMLYHIRNPLIDLAQRELFALFKTYRATIYYDVRDLLVQDRILERHRRRLRPDRICLPIGSEYPAVCWAPVFTAINKPLSATPQTMMLCGLLGAARLGPTTGVDLQDWELGARMSSFVDLMRDQYGCGDFAQVIDTTLSMIDKESVGCIDA
jgi:hypothetical protein